MKPYPFLFSLAAASLLAAACQGDEITDTPEDGQEGISVNCTTLNADIGVLRTLAAEWTAGNTVLQLAGETLTFSDGESVSVPVRTAYDFSYVNPAVGMNGGYWTLDGVMVPVKVADEALRLKGEDDLWYAYYNGAWNGLSDIRAGGSVPVFTGVTDGDETVSVNLGCGTDLSFRKYAGNEVLTLSESKLSFAKEGGSATFQVSANTSWTAKSDDAWISCSPESGGVGTTEVTVTVPADESYARSGSLVVSTASGDLSLKLNIGQEGELTNTRLDSDDVDPDDEDIVSNTEFDRTVYITFGGSQATVAGDVNGIVTVSGNHVTVDNTETGEKVIYELSGASADGSFKVYSKNKQAIVLNGLSLTNPSGAAINNQGKKRCFVVVRETNSLTDGSSYTGTPSDEDEKAAFFSEGQLVFSGHGTLTVTARGKAGITSDDYIRFMSSPTVQVKSTAGHGVRGKDAVIVSNGDLSVEVSAMGKKGISTDSLAWFAGGVTTVTSTAEAGTVDGSLTGTAGIKADQVFRMSAGSLTVKASGKGGKGIKVGDADEQLAGKCYLEGGKLSVTVTGANYGTSSSGGFGPWGGSSSSSNSKSAKGIKVSASTDKGTDGILVISGGTIYAYAASHEAIECKGTIEINGGDTYAESSDDAINASSHLTVNGGYVAGISSGNDGLDSNGNMYIKGGVVFAVATTTPEVALDANTEGGYKLYVSGGTLFAVGPLESGSSLTQACWRATSYTKGSWYAMTVGSDVYAFRIPSFSRMGSGLVVSGASTPSLKSGVTVTGGTEIFNGAGFTQATVSGGSGVSLSTYTSGSGGGGRPGW